MPQIYTNRGLSNCSTIQTVPVMTCPFGEQRVVNRTPVLDLKSNYGISALRDYTTQTSGGTISGAPTTGTGEYMLATTTTIGSLAALQSTERTSYQSGYGMEVGMGIRFPATTVPAGVRARWGSYDNVNGLFYQYDSVNRLSCNVMRNNTITQVVQSNFNIDTLDGTGPSNFPLDISRGIIFHITFSWYGYGAIVFNFVSTDPLGNTLLIPCHQFTVPGSTSTTNPHLPVRAELTNLSGSTASSVYVGGRQVSIIGAMREPSRITALTISSKTYNANLTYVMAFRKKAAFLGIRSSMSGVDMDVQNTAFIFVNNSCIVTGGTWVSPSNTLASETAIEVNTTFTAVTLGTQVQAYLQNATSTLGPAAEEVSLTDTDIMVLSVQAMTGVGNQTMSGAIVRIDEKW